MIQTETLRDLVSRFGHDRVEAAATPVSLGDDDEGQEQFVAHASLYDPDWWFSLTSAERHDLLLLMLYGQDPQAAAAYLDSGQIFDNPPDAGFGAPDEIELPEALTH